MAAAKFDFEPDILLEFVAESLEHLEGVDQQLMEFEQNPRDTTVIDGIFRAIHSIKGSSGFLQLDEINHLSHSLETLLDQLRRGERESTPEIMDLLFQGCDMLKSLVEEINQRLEHDIGEAVARDDAQLKAVYRALEKLLGGETDSVETAAAGNEVAADEKPVSGAGEAENGGVESGKAAADSPAPPAYNITPQLLQEFQVEAGEHLESCDQGMVQLAKEPDNQEAINAVFRDMHSVKGTASYLGLTQISRLAHAAESMLEVLRRGEKRVVGDEELDLLFEALDCLKEMVEAPQEPNEKAEKLALRIEERKEELGQEGGNAAAGGAASRPSTDPLAIFLDAAEQHLSTLEECVGRRDSAREGDVDIMFRAAHSLKSSARYMGFGAIEQRASLIEETLDYVRGGEIELAVVIYDMIIDAVKDMRKILADIEEGKYEKESEFRLDDGDRDERAAEPAPVAGSGPPAAGNEEAASAAAVKGPVPAPSPPRPVPAAPRPPAATPPKTMRVNQELLDTFMNLVGELIVARNAFGHIERRLELGERERAEALKELRGASLAVARISEEMQRTVMEMRMVPIRNVFQKFPRMVRDLTRKSGKQAQIVLQGEETEIDKGIAEDLADPLVHIIRNSVDHGLEPPEERRKTGKPESGTIILRAAHEGNFITIDIIDDGRGIDVDAVLSKAIEKGLVSREEAAGLSREEICNFIFRPGFSTARQVTDISGRGVGMDVVMTNLKKLKGNVRVTTETGQGTHVRLEVPLTLALVDALLVQVAEQTYAMPLEAVAETVKIRTAELKSLMCRKAITLRGEVLSVVDLADILGVARHRQSAEEEKELTLLILKLGASRLGVIVDRIQRKEEIVVKPLADYLAAIAGLAGASILGDGRSILILDPAEIMALAAGQATRAA